MKKFVVAGLVAVWAAFGLVGSAPAEVLLYEGFEGFDLKPYQSPTETPSEDGTDWTDELPAGWVSDFYDTPVGDPIEFQGWRIHDVDSWIVTEENQERNTWTRGGVGERGSVLLVDPDAYDDGTNIDDRLFNASIMTPAIDLSNIVPNTVSLSVDSFFRNEKTSDLYIDVSFDGGASYSNLWTIESDNFPENALFDEHLVFAVNNPESGSLVFRFSLLEGSNDWWWAIDNVTIQGAIVPEPSSFVLGAMAVLGLLVVARRRR